MARKRRSGSGRRRSRGRAGRTAWWTLLGLLVLGGVLMALGYARRHPEDLPWTPVTLDRPIGLFTGRKLAALRHDAPACSALLDLAGVRFDPVPDGAGRCGIVGGVRLDATRGAIDWRPARPVASCAVAAALTVWEWQVVQPAAIRWLGSPVVAIDHLGTYNCRRIYGRARGSWSEHATADAIDIAGFRLADGRRITLRRDWTGDHARSAFLHAARDGACRVFATTLSPDYNAAHADHLHLDQSARGWAACH